MSSDSSAIHLAVRHDQPARHGGWIPTSISNDLGCESHLAIEDAEQRLHVDDLRLDLNYQQGPCGCVPGKQINGPSLTVNGEGNFRNDRPPWAAFEPFREGLLHGGVTGAQHPIKLATAPASKDIHRDLERTSNATQRINRYTTDVATLDQ